MWRTFGRKAAYFCISLTPRINHREHFFVPCALSVRLLLPATFLQGFIGTLFFGWLPLYLPELSQLEFRAVGTGVTYNFGRFLTGFAVLVAQGLVHSFNSNYASRSAITALVYALGMIVIFFAHPTPLTNGWNGPIILPGQIGAGLTVAATTFNLHASSNPIDTTRFQTGGWNFAAFAFPGKR